MTLASLIGCVVVNIIPSLDRAQKQDLINRAAHLMIPMLAMPFLGGWYLLPMPADSRGWVLGGSPATMLFFMISVGASLAIGQFASGLVVATCNMGDRDVSCDEPTRCLAIARHANSDGWLGACR